MIRNYKVNKNPVRLANVNRIRTTDVDKKVWDYLKRYQSEVFVKKKLKREVVNNTGLITKKSQQIAATLVQSEKYFVLAKSSSLEISPLLLYYGMVGLAKCLILSGDNEYTLDYSNAANKHHRHHGLHFGADTPAEKIIRDGNSLLKEFCTVSSSSSRLGLYNLFRQCYSDTNVAHNTKVDVLTLLSYVPELHTDYYSQLNKKPRTWGCHSHFGISSLDGTDQLIELKDYYYHFQKRGNEGYEATIKRCFPTTETQYSHEGTFEDTFRLNNPASSIDDYIYVSDLITLEQYAFMKEQGYSFSDFDVHFLLMYILSNLVRYKQDKWADLISRKKNNDIFLIDSFMNVALTKFPWLILRELDNYNYTFIGQVATLG